MSKIVFGYMIAFIEQGKTPEEAKALAIRCEKLQRQAVEEIMTGIPSTTTAHTPEQLAEVDQAFGMAPSAFMDPSIPLPDSMVEYNQ
jgi:hypothetical protein